MTDKEAREVLYRYELKHGSSMLEMRWEITNFDRNEERRWHYTSPSYVDIRLATLTAAGQRVLELMPLANRIGRKRIKKIIAMLEAIAQC